MKINFTLFTFVLVCTLYSCNQKATLSEYKFSDKDPIMNCDGQDSKLLNEAIYSFEDDMSTYFKGSYNRLGRLDVFYSQFIGRSLKHMVNFEDLITPHTLEIFHVLKTKKDLWNPDSKVSKLNYYGSFFNCIVTNVQDKDFKTTLNALVTTHSMSPKMITERLLIKYRTVAKDNYLRAYVVFDLLYANLFDIDETKVKERNQADQN